MLGKGMPMSANQSSGATVVFADRPSRLLRIGLGVVTVIAGVLVLVWPDVAVVTVAIIVGIHLLGAGVVRGVTAFSADVSGGVRVLYVLLGLLFVVAGIMFLASPLKGIALLVLLFGVSWVVNGVIEMFHGFSGGGGWTIFSGAVSSLAGVAVLAYPAPSARAMVWLFGIALVAIGLSVSISAAVARRAS
jgi:uncharacterized membrane protein HdeD (DUF308 family)